MTTAASCTAVPHAAIGAARSDAREDEWQTYAKRAGIEGDQLKAIAEWDPWRLDKAHVRDLAQQLAHAIGIKRWDFAEACLLILLRSNLKHVLVELYDQRIGGLCMYLSEQCERQDTPEYIQKLAKAASFRVYVHLLLLVDTVSSLDNF